VDHRSHAREHLDALTNGEPLQRRIDPVDARLPVVVDPVVAVPTASSVTYLQQPRKDLLGRCVDRDGSRRERCIRAKQAITGHRTPDLAVRCPPASLPRAEHLEVRPDHRGGDEKPHEDPQRRAEPRDQQPEDGDAREEAPDDDQPDGSLRSHDGSPLVPP
jgi:hypothetical protein